MGSVHMIKPSKCCAIGSFECEILIPINGRVYGIDICISDIVAALNAANITTEASCCGHARLDGSILLSDGRELLIRKRGSEQPKYKHEIRLFTCDECRDRYCCAFSYDMYNTNGDCLAEK